MYTLQQKSWLLIENGYDYDEVATYALVENVSMDVAISMLWNKLLDELTEKLYSGVA